MGREIDAGRLMRLRVRKALAWIRVRTSSGYRHTSERVCAEFPSENFENHKKVYQWAGQFVVGARVLDVGCGTGYGTALLVEAGAVSALGIDISKEAIGYAQRKYPLTGLTFRQMDAQHLVIANETVDFVVSSENLEHLPDPRASVAEIFRVLDSGGIFLLGTPNKEMSSPGADRPWNPFHTKEFDFEELSQLLAEFFPLVLIIENTDEAPDELGRQLYAQRHRRGAVGHRVRENDDELQFAGRAVQLEHLNNTHSFIALAQK